MDGALILNSSRGGAVSDKAITGEEARAFRKELSVCCTSQTGTTMQFLFLEVDCCLSVFLPIFSLKENGTRHGHGTHEKKNRLQPLVFEDIRTCQNNLII